MSSSPLNTWKEFRSRFIFFSDAQQRTKKKHEAKKRKEGEEAKTKKGDKRFFCVLCVGRFFLCVGCVFFCRLRFVCSFCCCLLRCNDDERRSQSQSVGLFVCLFFLSF